MRIVFWQNCLSPHQLPYIARLPEDGRVDSVVVAAGEDISGDRRRMGWDITSFEGLDRCEVLLNPDDDTTDRLLSTRQEDSVHLFSGIRAFPFVFNALRRSLKYDLKRGIITERPNTFAHNNANGKPLWMHRIRFFLQDRTYARHIRYVFAMGDEAVDYFRSVWGGWTVFPFAYCTQATRAGETEHDDTDTARFLFVGSMSFRKAPTLLLQAAYSSGECGDGYTLDFAGDGSERAAMEEYIREHDMKGVTLLGTKNNSEIPAIMRRHDVLVLPSVYDGWGAVVNEALTEGLYVVCSDRCGACELLRDDWRGMVFKGGDYTQLSERMKRCAENIRQIRKDRKRRKEWAARHISGNAISKYMVDCLEGKKEQRPWM